MSSIAFSTKRYTYFIFGGVVLFFLLVQIILFVFDRSSNLIWFFTVFINIVIVFYYLRRSIPVVVILCFFLPYFFVPKYVFIDGLMLSFWSGFQTSENINFIAILNSIFLFSLFISIRSVSDKSIINKSFVGSYKSSGAFYIVFIILSIVLVFGIQGDSVFESGQYGAGQVLKSPIFEYFIIFFLMCLLFINTSSFFQWAVLAVILFLYTFKAIAYGGRIEVLQIWLLTFYLLFNFFYNRKLLLFFIGFFAVFAMDLISQVRTDPLLVYNFTDIVFFDKPIVSDVGSISTQFGDVYQSSMRIIGIYMDGYIGLIDSSLSFIYVLFGFFIPSSLMPPVYNLASYLQDVERSGGGGFISAFSFIWLSYFGPVFFGLFIGTVIRLFYIKNNIFFNTYGLLVLITFPRWFSYYPVVLFKMCLIGAVFFCVCVYIRNFYILYRRF